MSLKGFLRADVHHTEAFQVNTLCGGDGAEAFKLYALTFPLCYFLFLHLFHAVVPSLWLAAFFLSSSFLPPSLCRSETIFTESSINLNRLVMYGKDLHLHCIT